jgi:hypothetical protein
VVRCLRIFESSRAAATARFDINNDPHECVGVENVFVNYEYATCGTTVGDRPKKLSGKSSEIHESCNEKNQNEITHVTET